MKKQQTNVSVIKSIMEYGNPMKQVWIMTTLQEAAKQQAYAPAPAWGENAFISGAAWKAAPNWGDTAFISGEAWKAAAQEVYAELAEAGYGKKVA